MIVIGRPDGNSSGTAGVHETLVNVRLVSIAIAIAAGTRFMTSPSCPVLRPEAISELPYEPECDAMIPVILPQIDPEIDPPLSIPSNSESKTGVFGDSHKHHVPVLWIRQPAGEASINSAVIDGFIRQNVGPVRTPDAVLQPECLRSPPQTKGSQSRYGGPSIELRNGPESLTAPRPVFPISTSAWNPG